MKDVKLNAFRKCMHLIANRGIYLFRDYNKITLASLQEVRKMKRTVAALACF
jgi:hypothetical protein